MVCSLLKISYANKTLGLHCRLSEAKVKINNELALPENRQSVIYLSMHLSWSRSHLLKFFYVQEYQK